ncbi:unnamed protein product [Pedinophyceae sp. YPF-701]|nr:unnamed protein product [Pedinophyceae sp. YPF-701]
MYRAVRRKGDAVAAVEARPGHLHDAYDVGKEVGRGAYAVVHCAKRRFDGERVAVKLVDVFDMPPRKRDRCLREVSLMQPLKHPHVVQMHEAFLDANQLVLVLEWCPGGDLRRAVKRLARAGRRLEEPKIWAQFLQIAEGVLHLHSHRIIHRDLKPANVLVGSKGELKVADLGLGRLLGEESVAALSKVGTPYYVSPEVVAGVGHDWQSDVWSLGCILYELAALRSPFEGKDQKLPEVFRRVKGGEYDRLTQDHYSPALHRLVERMLRVDPARRPTVADVRGFARAALERLVTSGFDLLATAQSASDRITAAVVLAERRQAAGVGGAGVAAAGTAQERAVRRLHGTLTAEVCAAARALRDPMVLSHGDERAEDEGLRREEAWRERARRRLGVVGAVACWLLEVVLSSRAARWDGAEVRAAQEMLAGRPGGAPLAPADYEGRLKLARALVAAAVSAGCDGGALPAAGLAEGVGREACFLLDTLGGMALAELQRTGGATRLLPAELCGEGWARARRLQQAAEDAAAGGAGVEVADVAEEVDEDDMDEDVGGRRESSTADETSATDAHGAPEPPPRLQHIAIEVRDAAPAAAAGLARVASRVGRDLARLEERCGRLEAEAGDAIGAVRVASEDVRHVRGRVSEEREGVRELAEALGEIERDLEACRDAMEGLSDPSGGVSMIREARGGVLALRGELKEMAVREGLLQGAVVAAAMRARREEARRRPG